jgi:hypothetical protein
MHPIIPTGRPASTRGQPNAGQAWPGLRPTRDARATPIDATEQLPLQVTSCLQDSIVAVAADYTARKGITYTAVGELGIPALVLKVKEAGIPRTRRSS